MENNYLGNRREDNIKMDIKKVGSGNGRQVDELAQVCVEWRAFLLAMLNLRDLQADY